MKRCIPELRTQNSDIYFFDINYKYIIPLHKKNNIISQETPTNTRYIVSSADASLRYIEIFNFLTLKFSYHYINFWSQSCSWIRKIKLNRVQYKFILHCNMNLLWGIPGIQGSRRGISCASLS